jgi:hypothetical protein
MLSSCGVLLAGLALVPAGPGSAAPVANQYRAQGSSSADASCTVTSGSDSVVNGPKMLHHGDARGGVNLTTTWTSTGNASDVTTVSGHYGGTASLSQHHGTLRNASLKGSGDVTVTRALGSSSACAVGATLVNVFLFETHQPAGWYYVTRKTSKDSVAQTLVENARSGVPAIFDLYQGGASSITQRAFTKQGLYVTQLVAGIQGGVRQILLKSGGTVSRATLKNTLSVQFHNAGSAFNRAKGSATKFVKFPGSVSCSHHSAKLTWTGRASQVAGGAFFVNGKKKASVSNPMSGHHLVLHHLSPTADNTISVKLSLKGGGNAKASDLYVPCHY